MSPFLNGLRRAGQVADGALLYRFWFYYHLRYQLQMPCYDSAYSWSRGNAVETTWLIGTRGVAKGLRLRLHSERTTIGRHEDNVICLRDASVSRHHCVVFAREAGYSITDLDSNNGTLVNNELVAGERLLADRDEIVVGESVLRFQYGADGEEPDKHESDGHHWVGQSTVVLDSSRIQSVASEAFRADGADERTQRSLDALLGIGRLLPMMQRVDTLQRKVLELVAGVIPADSGAIVVPGYGEDTGAVCSWNRSGTEKPLPMSRTILRQVLRDKAAMLSVGPVLAPGWRSESLIARHVTSVLCVPLQVQDRLLGAIYLDSSDPSAVFDEDHLQLLTAIAGYAALAFDHARRMEALQAENDRLRAAVQLRHTMVGESPVMKDLYERIRRVARTDATVLILGESGTGKELAARALHMTSDRATAPFEAINCALLRNELLESELFGHEKGSFTGATSQKLGKLELADGGTVFLDEIGELGEVPQAMLLRVLQEREFTRVGGTRLISVSVRLIAATNSDLNELVKQKRFREDLFYRLNVIGIRIPPLRERKRDIPPLAEHFLRRSMERNKRAVGGISDKAMALLLEYPWPGNVRELENTIEYAVVFGSAGEITPEELPDSIYIRAHGTLGQMSSYHQAVRHAREQIVLEALRKASNNYQQAADSLGVHVNNLHRLIRELNLKPHISSK